MVASGDLELLQADIVAMAESPALEGAAIVDEMGNIIADSTAALRGQSAGTTSFAEAASLINLKEPTVDQHRENAELVVSAHHSGLVKGKRVGCCLCSTGLPPSLPRRRMRVRNSAGWRVRWIAELHAVGSIAFWLRRAAWPACGQRALIR
jgi:hypothetical protein